MVVDNVMYLYKGIVIGLAVSVPLGPMGVLLIQKVLQKGMMTGFVAGLGIVLADLVYSVLAAYGLEFVVSIVETHTLLLKIIGGIFLVIMGLKVYFDNPLKNVGHKHKVSKKGMLGDMITYFFLTLSNPVAILMFMAIFAGGNVIESDSNTISKLLLFSGIVAGATAWWYLVSFLVNISRKKFKMRVLLIINKIIGAILALVGVFVILSTFYSVLPSIIK